MSPDEVAAAARTAGVKTDSGDAAAAVQAIVQRLGQTVGSASSETAIVERDCIQWIARALHVSIAADAQTAAAENRLFVPLLVKATRQMLPMWRIAAHMVALNARSVREDAISLLERIFWRVLPSVDALDVLREELASLPGDGVVVSGVEMADAVRPDVGQVAPQKAWIEPLLQLCLVLGFSDGKFNREEERYFLAIANGLGVVLEPAQTLRDTTTRAFWSRRARLAPRNTENPLEVRANSLKAAYDCLDHIGAFNALTDLVCSVCVKMVGGTTQEGTRWPMRWLAQLTGRASPSGDNPVLRVALMAYVVEKASEK